MPDRAARRVLAAWIERIRPARERLVRARWAAACEATPEHSEASKAAAALLDGRLHDELGILRVEQSLAERIDEPLLRRALACLQRDLLPYRLPQPAALRALEADLAACFAHFGAEVDGRRLAAHEVAAVLRTSRDEGELERTWRAGMALGEQIESRVREAARLRNEHARALGLPDHRALALLTTEVDADELEVFLADLERGSDAAWGEVKGDLDDRRAHALGLVSADVRPWHYGDLFLQSLPPDDAFPDPFSAVDPVALTRRTFAGLGLDIESVLEASDLYPRDRKHPHAFCTHLDRAGDVRVLANAVPTQRWMRTLLHEFGHAAYDVYLDLDLPWTLIRPPHACATEGVAMLFGRLVHDDRWRERIAGLPPDTGSAERSRRELLTFVRWGLVMSRFEEALHADPDQDLDRVWWDLLERFQGVTRPDPLPSGAWAAKIHLSTAPVYYHAYLLGEAVASSLARHVREGLGASLVDEVGVGRWLVEAVFRPSATVRWDELIASATGSAPSASVLLADLAG